MTEVVAQDYTVTPPFQLLPWPTLFASMLMLKTFSVIQLFCWRFKD